MEFITIDAAYDHFIEQIGVASDGIRAAEQTALAIQKQLTELRAMQKAFEAAAQALAPYTSPKEKEGE